MTASTIGNAVQRSATKHIQIQGRTVKVKDAMLAVRITGFWLEKILRGEDSRPLFLKQ